MCIIINTTREGKRLQYKNKRIFFVELLKKKLFVKMFSNFALKCALRMSTIIYYNDNNNIGVAAIAVQRPTAPEVRWANELCRPGSCFTHTHTHIHTYTRTRIIKHMNTHPRVRTFTWSYYMANVARSSPSSSLVRTSRAFITGDVFYRETQQ